MKLADFGITTNSNCSNAHKEITRDGFKKLIAAFPTKHQACIAIPTTQLTLARWENKFNLYWPKDFSRADCRIDHENFSDDGKMIWERRLEQQLKVRSEWENYTGKATIMSCPHFPFAAYDRIEEMLAREDGKLGRLVIAGDILNFDALSLFRKEYNISPLTELRHAIKAIDQLKKYADTVLLMKANHDARAEKRRQERLSPGETELWDEVSKRAGPISYLADKVNVDHTDYWFIQLGDLFIAHPENGLTGKMRTAQRVYDFASVRWPSVRAVACGHTHAVGMIIHRKALLFEVGCMSRMMDYTLSGRIGPAATDVMYNAYLTAYFNKGKIDMMESRIKYLGVAP